MNQPSRSTSHGRSGNFIAPIFPSETDIVGYSDPQWSNYENEMLRRLGTMSMHTFGNFLARMSVELGRALGNFYINQATDQGQRQALLERFGYVENRLAPIEQSLKSVTETEHRLGLLNQEIKHLAQINDPAQFEARLVPLNQNLANVRKELEDMQGRFKEIPGYLEKTMKETYGPNFGNFVEEKLGPIRAYLNNLPDSRGEFDKLHKRLTDIHKEMNTRVESLEKRPTYDTAFKEMQDLLGRISSSHKSTTETIREQIKKLDESSREEYQRLREEFQIAGDDKVAFSEEVRGTHDELRNELTNLHRIIEEMQAGIREREGESMAQGNTIETLANDLGYITEQLTRLEQLDSEGQFRAIYEQADAFDKRIEGLEKTLAKRQDSVPPRPGRDQSLLGSFRRIRSDVLSGFADLFPDAQTILQNDPHDFVGASERGNRLGRLYPRLGDNSPELTKYYASKLPYLWRKNKSELEVLENYQKAVSGASRPGDGGAVAIDPALDNPHEIIEWVRSQKASDRDIAVKFKNDLQEYIGGQNFKIARGKIMQHSLEDLQRHLLTMMRSLADNRSAAEPLKQFREVLQAGGPRSVKQAIEAFKKTDGVNVEDPELAGVEDAEGRGASDLQKFRDLVNQYDEFNKDLDSVRGVINKARKDLQGYRQEELGVMDYLKNFDEDLGGKVTSLADNVTKVMESLREEKQHQKDLSESMRREMATHRGDVEKLVRSLWTREPVEQVISSVPKVRSGGGGNARRASAPEPPAIPRSRAPSNSSARTRPSTINRALARPSTKGSGTWDKIMSKYRARR